MDTAIDLDKVLVDLGHFGNFQKRNYVLICLVIVFSVLSMGYIFTTRNSKYRCLIEECDGESATYQTKWLENAIPHRHNEPERCLRYASIKNGTEMCDKSGFDSNKEVRCDTFVFENSDATIEKDFNITCDENLWKLTIVGTINSIGELVCLPLSGLVSDRYGRRTMMIISVMLSTLAGLSKSFSPNYITYVAMEFLDTCLGSGMYSAAYILAIELVIPEQRVLGNTLLACAFATGEAILGIAAWMSPSWRTMLRILYAPGFFIIFYYKFANESVRWLMSKGRHEESTKILKKVARANGTNLSDGLLEKLTIRENILDESHDSLTDIFRSKVLSFRLIVCSFCWICCNFVYYGLTMHSVSISGNLYINFITVAVIEMPAYLVSYYTLDVVGRKLSLSISLLLSGFSCILFVFIPEENATIQLALFLIGKFSVTIAYTTLYIHTTEMFPTNLRHSLLAVCSMFGRLGSMVAPQIPLLTRISRSLPLILFGAMASSSGLLSLLFPETLNTKLPDTIREAISIERKPRAV